MLRRLTAASYNSAMLIFQKFVKDATLCTPSPLYKDILMPTPSELISGTCQQLLFSPKGGIEGVLIKAKGKVLQVSLHPDRGGAFANSIMPGKRLRVRATLDHSPKTQDGSHPVYQFESFADAAGHAIESTDADPANTTIKGVVATLHYARHGQPNGVLLESGEFIHLRPRGMEQTGLDVGAKVNAVGEVRMTVLGTRLLEARQVNRIDLS